MVKRRRDFLCGCAAPAKTVDSRQAIGAPRDGVAPRYGAAGIFVITLFATGPPSSISAIGLSPATLFIGARLCLVREGNKEAIDVHARREGLGTHVE
jgi:hypothetical protein